MSNKGLLYWNIVLSVVLFVMALSYLGLLFLTDDFRDATSEDLILFEQYLKERHLKVDKMIQDRDKVMADMAEEVEELKKEVEAIKIVVEP